jgi:hypothetical protein
MSIGGPSPHSANDGAATSELSWSASSVRSFGGKNASTSNTPSFRIGGDWISPISDARSRSRPDRQAFSTRLERSTCSRLESGAASMPASVSKLVTTPSISSRSVSASDSQESDGARSEPTTLSGTPELDPGV